MTSQAKPIRCAGPYCHNETRLVPLSTEWPDTVTVLLPDSPALFFCSPRCAEYWLHVHAGATAMARQDAAVNARAITEPI